MRAKQFTVFVWALAIPLAACACNAAKAPSADASAGTSSGVDATDGTGLAGAGDDALGPPDAANDAAQVDGGGGTGQADTDTGLGADAKPAADVAADAASLPACATAADCPAPAACHVAYCTPGGTCAISAVADTSPCDDGNACTTQDTCLAGMCAGAGQLACDDANVCTSDACNPISGCVNLPVAATTDCSDADPCTQGDTCLAGQCEPGVAVCQCKNNADCGKFGDGNACNGVLYCDKSAGAPYTCKINPASVVVCPALSDNTCQKNTCVPATGECKLILAPANTPCSDNDPCTTGDFCEQGLCQGGTNTCYCKQDADCLPFEDGNMCNGVLFCNKATSQCQINPVSVVTCKTVDDTYCQQNLCNPKEGKCYLMPVHVGNPCDDGNACTPNETCSGGKCTSAVNICECQSDADCAKKDDGNLCTGQLYCDVASKTCVVNPATVVVCDTSDDPPCLHDTCDPATGKCSEIALPKDGTSCDDGNPCTPSSHCQTGKCQSDANICECQSDLDCAAKEDGNLCNGTLYCNKATNKCVVNPASVVTCASAFDETCLTNQCDPQTGSCGMKPTAQGNQCGDAGVCVGAGWCDFGVCKGVVSQVCECTKNSDCAAFEDGDKCNGTLYCDMTGPKPTCKVNPATVVVCKTVGDSECTKTQCQPKTGQCAATWQTGTCDDGKGCTVSDACKGGQCAGLPKGCDDGDLCTADSCIEPQGCAHMAIDVSTCDDGNTCTGDTCLPTKGCINTYKDTSCDDGDACTSGDVCQSGACIGNPSTCDDKNPCTDDNCLSQTGCGHKLNASPCSDGDACTQKDTCTLGKCAGKPVVCDDGNLCSDDWCDPKVGCQGSANAQQCDDGNGCTAKDTCKAGSCQGVLQCNDNNLCTSDACDGGICAYSPNTFECSDGSACTTGDVCSAGKCSGAGKLDCDDKNLCTLDSCDGQSGCVHLVNSQVCDDADKCTSADTCSAGACIGKKVACDDGNGCTTDACDPAKGCTATDNSAACSDGDACTAGDACAAGKCAPGKAILCDDGDFCTADSCDPATGKCANTASPKVCDDKKLCTDDACDGKLGCQHTYNTAKCDDGNACTAGDACSFGTCLSGAAVVCGDNNPCTDDSCDVVQGCLYAANTKGCDDKNGCTQKDLCSKGNCAGILSCDDNNPCTDDSCNFSKAACEHLANSQVCDDGDKCTSASACQGGSCQGLVATICDDGNNCTDNACDKDKGCNYPNNTLPCDTKTCTGEDQCAGGVCKSSGKSQYFVKTYNDPALDDYVLDMVATADGAIGVGQARAANTMAGAKSQVWRWGRAGSLLWNKKLNADLTGTSLSSVVRLSDGSLAATGWWDNGTGNGTDQSFVVRFDEAGNQLSRFEFGLSADGTTTPLDDRGTGILVSPLATDEVIVCGWGSTCGAGCNEDGWVVRYKVDGTKLAQGMHSDTAQLHQHFTGCTLGGDGKYLFAVGDNDDNAPGAKGQVDGEIVLFSMPDLKQVKVVRVGTGWYDFLFAVTTAADGSIYAAGQTPVPPQGSYLQRWYFRLDMAGNVLWEKGYPASNNNTVVTGLVPLPDGSVVGVGPWNQFGASAQQAFAQRLDPTSYEVKQSILGPVGNHRVDAAVRDDNGAIWIGASETVSYTLDAWVLRIDPWLNPACVQECGKKVWADCSDGNACTTDWCASDCATYAYAGACNDGDACTVSDTCAANTCAGSPKNCDDLNPCTQDSCDVLKSCQNIAYPEGFQCAVGKTCQSGACK